MRPQSILNYPRFHALCVQFAESDRQETLIFVTAYGDLKANDRSDDAQLIRCAFWYHQIHLTKRLGESAKKHLAAFPDEKLRFLKHATLKHALSTRRIYTCHFAQAIFRLRRGQSADYKRQLGIGRKIQFGHILRLFYHGDILRRFAYRAHRLIVIGVANK